MQETWVWSLGWENPLEESMATHSSILAWRIPMDREAHYSPCGHRVRHDWATKHILEWEEAEIPQLRHRDKESIFITAYAWANPQAQLSNGNIAKHKPSRPDAGQHLRRQACPSAMIIFLAGIQLGRKSPKINGVRVEMLSPINYSSACCLAPKIHWHFPL